MEVSGQLQVWPLYERECPGGGVCDSIMWFGGWIFKLVWVWLLWQRERSLPWQETHKAHMTLIVLTEVSLC